MISPEPRHHRGTGFLGSPSRWRDLVARTLARLLPRYTRRRKHRAWERRWSRDDYDPPWGGRGISPEIVEAVEDGFFGEGPVLDIGCGLGEIAAWFAERGQEAVGVDIAESVVERAGKLHSHLEYPPEFYARDLTVVSAPARQYLTLIDRGCFHQLASGTERAFLAHLLAVSAPDARLMLFISAFRGGIPFGDPSEKARQEDKVRSVFCPAFTIERMGEAFIDRHLGRTPDKALPGMVFRLRRAP